MAGTKFSGFTTGATTSNTFIVGYDSSAGTNNQYTLAQLAAGISPHISIDTIFTTSPSSTVPTGQIIKLTDTIQFQGPTTTYAGFEFKPATSASGAFGEFKVDGRIFLKNYAANDGWAFGGENTSNSFHFNTGSTGTMSDGYAMRVHANTVSPYGALILKGYGTSTAKTLTIQDSGGNETFSIQDDGVAKYTGQAYTELHTGVTDMTFNWNNSNIQSTTMGASTPTFAPSNPKAGATYILTLAQTGAVTVNWNSLVKWPAGTAPTLSGSGKTDVVTLICYDAAANSGAGAYYGSATLDLA